MTAFKTERDFKKNDENQIKKQLIFVHIYILSSGVVDTGLVWNQGWCGYLVLKDLWCLVFSGDAELCNPSCSYILI